MNAAPHDEIARREERARDRILELRLRDLVEGGLPPAIRTVPSRSVVAVWEARRMLMLSVGLNPA